jgi:hypothetical protein
LHSYPQSAVTALAYAADGRVWIALDGDGGGGGGSGGGDLLTVRVSDLRWLLSRCWHVSRSMKRKYGSGRPKHSSLGLEQILVACTTSLCTKSSVCGDGDAYVFNKSLWHVVTNGNFA